MTPQVPGGKDVQQQRLYDVDGVERKNVKEVPQIEGQRLPGNTDVPNVQTVFGNDLHQRVKNHGQHMPMGMPIQPQGLAELRKQGQQRLNLRAQLPLELMLVSLPLPGETAQKKPQK